jgi:hypothetical protein
MDYKNKYLKYKNKYINLKNIYGGNNKIFNDTELNTKLINFYEIIKNNDLYKRIYNKFIYLPIKNNIQIILRYYPNYNCEHASGDCMINIRDLYNIKYTLEETDINGNKYYYRNITHLHDMLKNEYINYFTINNIKIVGQNIIPTLEWRDYIICPTIDPVHNNHILLIRKQQMRMYEFYFPTSNNNLLKDMTEFSRLTGNYIYCSIELGSIPEYVHFHTSSEIPPLDNITNINKNNLPLFYNDLCRFYKIDYNGCYDSYYFEISNNFIDNFVNILPVILYNNRYIDSYKYMSQVFVCPYKYDFYRIIITFRRVKQIDTIPIDGKYSESYYQQLFNDKIEICYGKYIGYKDNLRFNILGYEPITINYTSSDININKNKFINNDNINDYCLDYTNKFFNNFCKNVFHFNKNFEENITKKLNEFDFKKLDNHDKLYDIYLYNRIIYNIDVGNIDINTKLINLIPNINIQIIKEINIDKAYYIITNNTFFSVYFINIRNLINHLYYSKKLYDISPLFHTKIFNVGKKDNDTYYIFYKSIYATINNFMSEEYNKYHNVDSIKNYSNVFFLMILYQMHVLYKDYKLIYTNFDINSIYITTDFINDKHLCIELNFKLDKKILIFYKDGRFNFYGFKAVLLNIYKLIQSDDVNIFKKSLQKIKDIFVSSDIKDKLNLDLNYPDCLYNFVDVIGNDNLNDNSITRDNINILSYHQNIIKHEKITGMSNFKEKLFEELYNKILQKKDDILPLLNKYKIITIPKNTKFITASSFNLKDFNESKEKYLLEYNWEYKQKNPNWFHSDFNLNLEDSNFKEITDKGIKGAIGDFYLKQPPYNFTRHLIFKNNRDINLLITEFNGINRLNFHKKLLSIIYDNIFDKYEYYIDEKGVFNNEFDSIIPNFGMDSLDSYVVFIMSVLKENNLIDIDGYVGMDWFEKKYNNINGTNIEYVLLEPSYLKLLGLYYYDYYENNFKLFSSYHKWNNFFFDRIKKLKNILDDVNHINNPNNEYQSKKLDPDNEYQCKKLDQNCINKLYPFDYSLIVKKYIYYLKHILKDNYILNQNDFYDSFSDNNILTYKIDIID